MSNPTNLVSNFDGSLAYTTQGGSGSWTMSGTERYSGGLWLAPDYRGNVLDLAGLAAYWRLDEASGDAIDLSGNGNDGTVKGDVTRQVASLVSYDTNLSYTMGGTNSEIEGTPTLGDEYTMLAWFSNAKSFASDLIAGYILSRGALSETGITALDAVGILGSLTPGDEGKLFVFNGTDLLTGITVTSLDTAYHLAFVRNGTNVKVYLNGVLEINDTLAISYANSNVCAGRRVDNAFSLQGGLDDVAFVDEALSIGQITGMLTTASAAAIDPTGILSPNSGAMAFAFTRGIDTGGIEYIVECGEDPEDWLRIFVDASDKLNFSFASNGGLPGVVTSVASVPVGTEQIAYIEWSGTSIALGLNGAALVTGTRDPVMDDWDAGDLTLKASAGSYVFGPFATYNQPLSPGYRTMVEDEIEAGGANLATVLDAGGGLYGRSSAASVLTGSLSVHPSGL